MQKYAPAAIVTRVCTMVSENFSVVHIKRTVLNSNACAVDRIGRSARGVAADFAAVHDKRAAATVAVAANVHALSEQPCIVGDFAAAFTVA